MLDSSRRACRAYRALPATMTRWRRVEYFFKAPTDLANRLVIVVDPMLATANSAIAAVSKPQGNAAPPIFAYLLPAGGTRRHRALQQAPTRTCRSSRPPSTAISTRRAISFRDWAMPATVMLRAHQMIRRASEAVNAANERIGPARPGAPRVHRFHYVAAALSAAFRERAWTSPGHLGLHRRSPRAEAGCTPDRVIDFLGPGRCAPPPSSTTARPMSRVFRLPSTNPSPGAATVRSMGAISR